MSRVYGVRSYGSPYFAATQEDSSFMDPANAPREDQGQLQMEVLFSLEALPVKLASDDEAHPLFSYADAGANVDMAWIGVSPSGRIMAQVTNGPVLQSSPGLVVPGKRYGARALLQFEQTPPNSLDQLLLSITDTIPVSNAGKIFEAIATPVRTAAIPTTVGQFVLFNGAKGQTRCACTIYDALFLADDGLKQVRWLTDDGRGERIAWSLLNPATPYPNAANFNLTIIDKQGNPPLWGPHDGLPLASKYRWVLETPWTRRALPQTVWSQR